MQLHNNTNQILIVEDSTDIRIILERLLKSEGYDIHSCTNGQEALEYLHTASHMPKLILLDLMMPIMDGFQFREQQIRDQKLSNIPVIVMTAGNVDMSLIKSPMPEVFRKPLDADALLDSVGRYCMQ